MESMVLPVISFAILILLLLGVVVFLAILQTKQNTEVARFLTLQNEKNAERQREQADLTRDAITEILAEHSSSVSESLSAATQLLSSTVKEVTFGASSSVSELTKTVRETTTLLAAKDPIAYQMAVGAQATQPESGGWRPYTSTEAEAEAEATRRTQERIAIDDLLRNMTTAIPGAANVDAYAAFNADAG